MGITNKNTNFIIKLKSAKNQPEFLNGDGFYAGLIEVYDGNAYVIPVKSFSAALLFNTHAEAEKLLHSLSVCVNIDLAQCSIIAQKELVVKRNIQYSTNMLKDISHSILSLKSFNLTINNKTKNRQLNNLILNMQLLLNLRT